MVGQHAGSAATKTWAGVPAVVLQHFGKVTHPLRPQFTCLHNGDSGSTWPRGCVWTWHCNRNDFFYLTGLGLLCWDSERQTRALPSGSSRLVIGVAQGALRAWDSGDEGFIEGMMPG